MKTGIKVLSILVLVLAMMLLCSCEVGGSVSANITNNNEKKGKCLEYETQYKLDCGWFVDSESFCKERKYDVCIRWEEDNNEHN